MIRFSHMYRAQKKTQRPHPKCFGGEELPPSVQRSLGVRFPSRSFIPTQYGLPGSARGWCGLIVAAYQFYRSWIPITFVCQAPLL